MNKDYESRRPEIQPARFPSRVDAVLRLRNAREEISASNDNLVSKKMTGTEHYCQVSDELYRLEQFRILTVVAKAAANIGIVVILIMTAGASYNFFREFVCGSNDVSRPGVDL